MVRWVVGSILHGVDPLSYFSFQPVHHDWCSNGRGMCYTVCGMMHIKEPLLLIAHVVAAGFLSHYLSCFLPYVRRHITVNKMCWVCRYIKHFLPSLSNCGWYSGSHVVNTEINPKIHRLNCRGDIDAETKICLYDTLNTFFKFFYQFQYLCWIYT